MEDYGAFCPNEECANNHAGTCGLRQAALLGMTSWAFLPFGTTNFMAPMGAPVASLLSDDESAEDREDSADRGLFYSCPHHRSLRD